MRDDLEADEHSAGNKGRGGGDRQEDLVKKEKR
jgi:hypothetical protein